MGVRLSLDMHSHSESIAACHRARQWQLALGIVNTLEGRSTDLDTALCNLAISVCETGRRWRDAMHLFGSARKMSADVDVVTITAAMSACETSNHWQRALALFQKLQARRLQPTGFTYRALISACIAGGRTRWARHVVEDMARQSVEGAVIALNDAITKLGQSAAWKPALSCVEVARSQALLADAITYTALTSAFSNLGRWQTAFAQLELLRDCELQGGEVMAGNAALSACSGHLWPQALALFQDLKGQRLCSSVTYCSLMTLCERGGRWEIALDLLLDVERSQPAAVSTCFPLGPNQACKCA